jgi:hypothetical protein
MTEAVKTPAFCASCGHAVTESYCARCGEEVLDPSKLTLRYFLSHTVVHELLNLDGKIWRTLRLLLFRPGSLALEYAAGRRRPYVNPLRVLIVAIVVYVLATQGGLNFTLSVGPVTLSILPAPTSPERPIADTLGNIDRFGVLEHMFAERFGPSESASDDLRRRFNRTLNGFATPLSFATVLLVALVLYACFRRRRPLFVEHAAFSMQVYSFVLLSSVLTVAIIKLELFDNLVALALIMFGVSAWQAAYFAVALRRFYWHLDSRRWVSWTQAVGVAILLYLLNAVFLTSIQFLGGAVAIWRL